jgi:alanyl-tRNA synthetase
MFGDRITPSNVKEGYLARLVLRRTLRLIRELKLEKPISELMALESMLSSQSFGSMKATSWK